MPNVPLVPAFRHRENLDGTWDSICLRCYGTAVHTHRETLLAAAESAHRCDESSWFFRTAASAAVVSRPPKITDHPAPSRLRVFAPIPSRPYEHVQPGHQTLTFRRGGRSRGVREPGTSAGV